MPDTTPASAPSALEVRRTFAAPRQRVFDAWTTAEALKGWHAPVDAVVEEAGVDFRVGGRWFVVMRGNDGTLHRVGGTYREIDAPSRIVLTWRWEVEPEHRESLVTVQFIDRGSRSEVVLTHTRLATDESIAGHRHGWVGCLEKLEGVVAARE
jgi:uncharacterized protein YndB with AHSA1/START domain